ncbi:hypothetical protein QNN11_11600 [Phocaeicola dorei]|uniref:Uncharacterized protein n=1 Tax=Phocaeicola dorei TaxID=357276 RepID=A0AA95KXP4_9BACT|nr:hypothetical protein QNN11_11600 [Phocaeicola dorei]
MTVDFSNFYIESKKFGHVLCKITTSGNIQLLTCGYSNLLGLDANTNTSAVKWSGKLLAGERLQYAIFNHQRMSVQDGRTVRIHNNTGITSWNDLGDPVNIDVISPLKLLSRLLESISANSERIYCSIKPTIRTYISNAFTEKDNWRLNGSRLVAAESIRNFEKAKIYSSFSKFCEWMETVFGYVYTIEMKSRPNTDLPYADILNNSHDFEGFTTYKANITSITDNFTLHFSTTAGYFLAIVYASITLDRSPNFPVMKDIRFTTMPTNHIKCTKTDTIMIQWMICIIMQFMMTVQKRPRYSNASFMISDYPTMRVYRLSEGQ